MSFEDPWFLLALVAVPLAILGYLAAQRRRSADVVRFTGLATLASVMPARSGVKRHVPPVLYVVALAALAIALARPEVTVSVPRDRASIVLTTDVSGSMMATDVAPDRLASARAAANTFLDQVPDRVRVGLVAFSNTATVLQRPTTDRGRVREALASLRPQGGTATGEGLRTALQALADLASEDAVRAGSTPGTVRPPKRPPAAIVLLSDGTSTSGADPVETARRAKRLGVPIYTIALGTPDGRIELLDSFGQPQVINVPPDPIAMADIARASGGQYFDAFDSEDLESVYERLGSRLGTVDEQRDITAAFAGGGLLLVLLGGGLSLLWLGRLP